MCRHPLKQNKTKNAALSASRGLGGYSKEDYALLKEETMFFPVFLCLQWLWLNLQIFLVSLSRDPSFQDKTLGLFS